MGFWVCGAQSAAPDAEDGDALAAAGATAAAPATTTPPRKKSRLSGFLTPTTTATTTPGEETPARRSSRFSIFSGGRRASTTTGDAAEKKPARGSWFRPAAKAADARCAAADLAAAEGPVAPLAEDDPSKPPNAVHVVLHRARGLPVMDLNLSARRRPAGDRNGRRHKTQALAELERPLRRLRGVRDEEDVVDEEEDARTGLRRKVPSAARRRRRARRRDGTLSRRPRADARASPPLTS
jgi:hypothetical protein